MTQILLSEIFPLQDLKKFKLHCASWNKTKQPLNVFVNDREEWHGWNRSKPDSHVYNREYIFSLINFYHEENTWLFGGIYKVLGLKKSSYEIELSDLGESFIGRLKIDLKYSSRQRRLLLEKQYPLMTVKEILPEIYSGETFVGFENINIGFEHLETLVRLKKESWKSPLQSIKGIYLVTDHATGKNYVGSAYGGSGIWSRWQSYVETGHGWSDQLTALIKKQGLPYARKNFVFSLLEYRPMRVDDQVIIDRETFWKKVLLSRSEYGYNSN